LLGRVSTGYVWEYLVMICLVTLCQVNSGYVSSGLFSTFYARLCLVMSG